jgi:hypothetical protein
MVLSGYSATPLAKKLSLKGGMRTWWDEMPPAVRHEIEGSRLALTHLLWPEAPIDAAHIFVTERADMEADLKRILPHLAPAGFVWVSWPKQAARIATDINENVIREVALPMGLVDTKVCAVDETWSGLKLVIRKALRGEGPGVQTTEGA